MAKLWAGRTDGNICAVAEEFNASISFDRRLFAEDIKGSVAHAEMLAAKHIISAQEARQIVDGLLGILDDVNAGTLAIDENAEDIHTFVEQTLTERIGEAGKKLHTARSRNDQVALDMRLYTRNAIDDMSKSLRRLIEVIVAKAEKYQDTIMCGYTHLQRAQPITFGHHLAAYAFMFLRDLDRLRDCRKRLNSSPIGACALAGTTYPTDRQMEAAALGFDEVVQNSIDAVSDRDYLVELLADLSLLMTHISRFAEEIVLWCSWEFGYIRLSDDFTTGSSIMPQKKNPDIAELARGKTGRVYGDLMALLTVFKGLPLAYNKDMQEDKESAFDAMDTVGECINVFTPMVASIEANADKMLAAAKEGFINATDLADYLAQKGVPFRTAYHTVGKIVAYCVANGKTLEDMGLEEYQSFDLHFAEDVYQTINLENCVRRRISQGGTSPESVRRQIEYIRAKLN